MADGIFPNLCWKKYLVSICKIMFELRVLKKAFFIILEADILKRGDWVKLKNEDVSFVKAELDKINHGLIGNTDTFVKSDMVHCVMSKLKFKNDFDIIALPFADGITQNGRCYLPRSLVTKVNCKY